MKQITLFVLFQLAILATANLKRNLAKRQSDEVHLTALKEQIQEQIIDGTAAGSALPFILSKGLNQFNHDLFPALAQVNDANIVISPFSIHTALTMTMYGAPADSNTYKQLSKVLYGSQESDSNTLRTRLANYLNVLNFYENVDQDINIKLGNKAFAYEALSLKADYVDFLTTYFKSGLQRVNFQESSETANIINNYVGNVTDGLIDEIVQPSNFNADTRLVLINAIYFKANWGIKFNETKTKPMKFQINNGLEIDYPHGMNMKEHLFYANMTNFGFPAQVLELPYEGGDFRMILILPNSDINIEDLDLQNLDYDILESRSFSREIRLTLPRFKMEFEADMQSFLKQLGIADLFDISKANLTDIADDQLYVSDITHKSVIEVNEEGSEAAGVSAVQINTRGSNLASTLDMKFDRPFYFIIQDKLHKLNLFMGRVVDPSGIHGLGRFGKIVKPNPEPEVQSPVVRQNEEASVKPDPKCGELGYQTGGENDAGKIALPCDGELTLPLRDQEDLNNEEKTVEQTAEILFQ